MKRPTRSLVIALTFVAFAASSAWAGTVTIPNRFEAGTTAKAADVNANFDAVKGAVDDNDTRITTNANDIANNGSRITTNENDIAALSGKLATVDMDSYKPTVGLVKVMRVTTYQTTEPTQSVTISWDGSNEEWDYGAVTVPPSREIFELIPGPDSLLVTHYDRYGLDPEVAETSIDYDPPLADIQGSGEKPIGGVWGGAAVRTMTTVAQPGMAFNSTATGMFTILGREDVVVTAGSFPNCVKVFRNYAVAGSARTSVYWLAEGFGWVKRIDAFPGDLVNSRLYEMTSYAQ